MTDHCGDSCPFRDCPDCPWSGENPTTATVSDARTGVGTDKIALAMTNGPGLHTGTVLAAQVRFTEREDYRTW